MLRSIVSVLVLLLAQLSEGNYVRRAAVESSQDFFEDSAPIFLGEPSSGLVLGAEADTNDNGLASFDDEAIRNGYVIAPLPWYAVFQSRTLCGASLIHGDILITAAHCVDDNGLPGKVRVGSTDYFTGGRVTNVIGGILHPAWSWEKPSDPDLAILVLQDFLPNQVAELNSDPETPAASHPSVFAMGFGLTDDKHTSRTLLGAEIPYLDNCSYRSSTYDRPRHLCADSRRISTCGGDSGSPITLGESSRLQVGINSYSNGKCSLQTLDFYTRISYFYDWIHEQVCTLSSLPPESCLRTEHPTFAPTIVTPSLSPTHSTQTHGLGTAVPTLNESTSRPSSGAPSMAHSTSTSVYNDTTRSPTRPDADTPMPTSNSSLIPTTHPSASTTSSPTSMINSTMSFVPATTIAPTATVSTVESTFQPSHK